MVVAFAAISWKQLFNNDLEDRSDGNHDGEMSPFWEMLD